MATSYSDMLAQLGIAAPLQQQRPQYPTPGATVTPPVDETMLPGFPPFPMAPAMAPALTAPAETTVEAAPTSGIIPTGGPATAATGTPAYQPATRPELPKAMTRPKNADVFGDFSSVYAPPPPEDNDPLAALMASKSPMPGMPGSQPQQDRSLVPAWMQGAEGPDQNLDRGQSVIDRAAQNVQHSPAEQALLRKSPAYGRAIDRIRTLDRFRTQRDMGGRGPVGPSGPQRPGGGMLQRRI